MAFHLQDGWHFERLEDGSVRLYIEIDGRRPFATVATEDSWASAVSAVSAEGENSETHQAALELHRGKARAARRRRRDGDE
jgi:hypothetical protein